ncbi:MAG: hypothetical protein LBF86_03700 [Helicobacteraceae bacterium]|jgi:hypothetical protein|nr:hypothetical protein [Helicobacteraceae bacterium]
MQSVLKAALCIGVAAQILSAGDTLVDSGSLDGYTKYAVFSFYGKRASDGEASDASLRQTEEQSSPTSEAATQSDAGLASDETAAPSEDETLALEEEDGTEEPAIDAEPQASSTQEQPAAKQEQSQFYGGYSEEEDCGDYCK